jgi:hypothetical protein
MAGVDFTNILCTAFTRADPKSAKKTDCLTVLFVLLRSVHVKAARKMLMKSTHAWLKQLSIFHKMYFMAKLNCQGHFMQN